MQWLFILLLFTIIKFNKGFIYFNGEFLYVKEQKKILGIGNNEFSGSIGLEIISTINERTDLPDLYSIEPVLSYRNPSEFADSLIFTEQQIKDNFIEFIRIDKGVILKDVRIPIYNDLEKLLAHRIYDESGSFTVTPFIAKVFKNIKDSSTFRLDVSPGKAYVLGYEFDSIATRTLSLDRSLDTYQKELYELPTNYGSFIILKNFSGFFDCQKVEKIDLLNKPLSELTFVPWTEYSNSIVGYARVRHVKYYEDELHLYLFDFSFNENKSFSDVKSVCTVYPLCA